jgi:hypothetical protein
MASISFSQNIRSHVAVDPRQVSGRTVRDALEAVFVEHPRLASYVLDDRGAVRKHVAVFLDGHSIRDREGLSDPLPANGELFVMQALSGG